MEKHRAERHLRKPTAQGAFVRGALSQRVTLTTFVNDVRTAGPALGQFGGLLRS